MIPRRAREPLRVGRRPCAGEPQILCTFQLDTRSLDRSVSGTPCASGEVAFVATLALILMGDWCGINPRHLSTETPESLNRHAAEDHQQQPLDAARIFPPMLTTPANG